MTEKYKLRITISWPKSATKTLSTCRSWIWESKEDALACKALLEKAVAGRGLTVEFVSFAEEQLLEDKP